jgi:RNA polymerase subunit RPABC4/transcription elongation factor Spt4
MATTTVVPCTDCGNNISRTAPRCPHCGASRGEARHWAGIIVRIVLILLLVGLLLPFLAFLI